MSTERLGLLDREFWDDPERTSEDVDERLTEAGFLGLLLDAPTQVSITQRDTLPVVLYHNATFERSRAVSVKESAIVTAIDLLSGRGYAGMVVPRREDYAPPVLEEVGDDEPPPEGTTSALYVTELREALHLPWKRAELLVTVIMRDERSNRVRVSLGPHPQDYRDEAVEEFLAAERLKTGPKDVRPPLGTHYPYYARLPVSPPLPEQSGIGLQADRVVVLREAAKSILHGSWRLPLLPQEIAPAGAEGLSDWQQRPTAIKRIALVATGSRRADPVVVSLQVPSFDPVPAGETSPVVTGYFAIDLLDLLPAEGQTFFVYALAGEVMAGPVAAAFVSEELVPPGVL